MKRAIIIVLILTIAIGATLAGYYYATPTEPKSVTEDPNVEIVTVALDTLVDTVNATGHIEPKAEVDMKFKIGGVVENVLVERGQQVTAGTVLAELDTEDLQLEVQRAEIDLDQQEAELEKLLEPELQEKVASAQARLQSARLNLADLQDGPDEDEVQQAAADLSLTRVALQKAQWAYDQVAYRADIGGLPQADALQEATLNYEKAQATYNIAVREPSEAEIAEARAAVAEAGSTLADLLKGASPADIASQQASVDKARLALRETRDNLQDAVLVAPTDGVVLEVNIERGERVLNEADEAVMVIADTSAYLLKVKVDEIDIGRIKRNQQVDITIDAYPDEVIEGQVADVAPSPSEGDTNGIVAYEVTIAVNTGSSSSHLLPGMSATAAVETQRLKEVVVVPNQAIQIDRESTPPIVYVEKLDEQGNPMRVEVELGLRSGSVTQVEAGLEAGDEVIIRTEPELEPEL